MSALAQSGSSRDRERFPHGSGCPESFGIGPADLDANRAGRLGPRQLRAVRVRATQRIAGLATGTLAAAVAAATVRGPLWTWVLLGGLAAGALVATVGQIRHLRAAPRAEVRRLTGVVAVTLLYRHNRGWWLTVEGRSFRLPIPFSDVDNGEPYHVYYQPAGHRLVALERAPGHRLRAEVEPFETDTFEADPFGRHPYGPFGDERDDDGPYPGALSA